MSDSSLKEEVVRWVISEDSGKPLAWQDLGALGLLFGGRQATINIAGLVVAAMLMLLAIAFTGGALEGHEREFITSGFSLLSLTLGYLLGTKAQP